MKIYELINAITFNSSQYKKYFPKDFFRSQIPLKDMYAGKSGDFFVVDTKKFP